MAQISHQAVKNDFDEVRMFADETAIHLKKAFRRLKELEACQELTDEQYAEITELIEQIARPTQQILGVNLEIITHIKNKTLL